MNRPDEWSLSPSSRAAWLRHWAEYAARTGIQTVIKTEADDERRVVNFLQFPCNHVTEAESAVALRAKWAEGRAYAGDAAYGIEGPNSVD